MKNFTYCLISFVFMVGLTSCNDYNVVKQLDEVSGNWELISASYTSEYGKRHAVNNVGLEMNLSKELPALAKADGTRVGKLYFSDGNAMGIQYSIDFSQGYIDIKLQGRDKNPLPEFVMGRAQVYKFKKQGDNFIEFTVDKESDPSIENDIVRNDVKYSFKRK